MITEKDIIASRTEFLDLALNLYGIKLDGYRPEFIDRRLGVLASKNGFNSMFQLKHELVNNELFAKKLEMNIAVNVTEMFRDPLFFKVLKNVINSNFKTRNELRIWHPACSKGHEVFSLAILLKEIGKLENSILYGTDICHESINEARKGVIRGKELKKYSTNYLLSGGKNSLSEYFKISYDNALLSHSIKERIKFSYHKLGTDSSFQKFQMILCRNLFIYFNPKYQSYLLNSLIESLEVNGILCMGLYEPIEQLEGFEKLECIDNKNKIYKKK